MSEFSDVITGALASARDIAGEAVAYKRGASTIALTNAVPIVTRGPADRDGAATLESDELDWGINRASLTLSGNEITPARGDTIVWVKGGKTLTYAVLPRDSQKPWRWSDTGQSQYRIFTTLMSKV